MRRQDELRACCAHGRRRSAPRRASPQGAGPQSAAGGREGAGAAPQGERSRAQRARREAAPSTVHGEDDQLAAASTSPSWSMRSAESVKPAHPPRSHHQHPGERPCRCGSPRATQGSRRADRRALSRRGWVARTHISFEPSGIGLRAPAAGSVVLRAALTLSTDSTTGISKID